MAMETCSWHQVCLVGSPARSVPSMQEAGVARRRRAEISVYNTHQMHPEITDSDLKKELEEKDVWEMG